jgi:hypothetical protein
MASEIIAKKYRGTFWKIGAIVMKLVPNVYIVGAHALGTDNATMTMRNLPNPPLGARTADIRPPMLSPPSNPVAQDGTAGADAVKAAPRK